MNDRNSRRRSPPKKATIKKIPWLSLLLLLLAYSSFSWFLYRATVTWVVWLLAFMFALLQAMLLTTFSNELKRVLSIWIKSDAGYFSTIIVFAFLVAVAFVWIQTFSYILVVVAAEMLARLDLQRAEFGRSQALSLLTLVSLSGLAVGWTASQIW